jgi:hypothetical protein
MDFSFIFFLNRRLFQVGIYSLVLIAPLMSMEDLYPSEQDIRTIEIFPRMGLLTTIFNPMPIKENQDSQYTNAFGRGKIFEIISTNQWQRDVAVCAMKFDGDIEKLGIGQNYIFVSLSCGLNAKVHHNIPHLFFSGNAEKVYDQIFINTTDILRRFPPREETQRVSSNNINSSVIRNTFLKPDNTPTDYAKERTLEFIVQKHFPNMFYGIDHTGFFVFPIHQVILIDQPLVAEPKSKKSQVGKNTNQTTQVNCSENEPDFLTCQFRDFIYSSFAEGKEVEIEKHIKNEDLDLMLQILNNIITHAKDNSNSQAIPTTQRSIMRSVLAERYVRQNPYSVNILEGVFDLTSFDDVFGRTGRESHESIDTMSVMSNCFLHSEQAYLKMTLQLHQRNVTNFIISYIVERSDKINVGMPETISFDLMAIADKNSLDAALDDTDFDIDQLDDPDNEGEIVINDDIKEGEITSKELETHKTQEKVLQFTFEEPIVIDIISPRHICKFCRGSLHLRCNDIQQRNYSTRPKIEVKLRKRLVVAL